MIENSEGSLGKIQFSVGPAFFVSWWNWKRRCWLPCGCECHSVLIGNISSPMSFGALRYGSAAWAPSLICNFDNLTTWLVPSQIDIFGIPALTCNHFCYSSCPKTTYGVGRCQQGRDSGHLFSLWVQKYERLFVQVHSTMRIYGIIEQSGIDRDCLVNSEFGWLVAGATAFPSSVLRHVLGEFWKSCLFVVHTTYDVISTSSDSYWILSYLA